MAFLAALLHHTRLEVLQKSRLAEERNRRYDRYPSMFDGVVLNLAGHSKVRRLLFNPQYFDRTVKCYLHGFFA